MNIEISVREICEIVDFIRSDVCRLIAGEVAKNINNQTITTEALQAKRKLEAVSYTIETKADDEGILCTAIGKDRLAKAIGVPTSDILSDLTITELGLYSVVVCLSKDTYATVKVWVVPDMNELG